MNENDDMHHSSNQTTVKIKVLTARRLHIVLNTAFVTETDRDRKGRETE